ncbi:unnamed protein product, partial [Chrysoparadoxa australica]
LWSCLPEQSQYPFHMNDVICLHLHQEDNNDGGEAGSEEGRVLRKWKALKTCAYVSGLQTYVHEKQRVESLLESELCRCHENEHAIAANYEVTVQGDLD